VSFDLSEYVDVAERIRIFKAAHPEGSLQSEVTFVDGGVLCKARAYRSPEDLRAGVGHAFEPIPGKTPYTKDSEVMNAETSAWGRAIVALGFETKKIASADEVRNRQGNGNAAGDLTTPPDDAKPSEYVIHFGKNRGTLLSALTLNQLLWYANEWKIQDEPSEYDHRLKAAAVALAAGDDTPITADPYPEVPFYAVSDYDYVRADQRRDAEEWAEHVAHLEEDRRDRLTQDAGEQGRQGLTNARPGTADGHEGRRRSRRG